MRTADRIEEMEEEARRLREEDEEAKLEELIATLVGPVNAEWYPPPVSRRERVVREDEFVCASCHMVLHRSLLGDRERRLCVSCEHVLRRPRPRVREGARP